MGPQRSEAIGDAHGLHDLPGGRGLPIAQRVQDAKLQPVDLSDTGRALFLRLVPTALDISARTLGPLSQAEQRQLLDLLARLA